jgi:hypothetical protein
VAAIEFALLLMPLALLMYGATEFGRAIYTYNSLEKTVRDAVRHMSQHGPGEPVIQEEARCLAVYGNTGCSGTPVAPGLATSAVTVCDATLCPSTHSSVSTGLASINLVTVSIQGYTFTSAVSFVMPTLNFNEISATMQGAL